MLLWLVLLTFCAVLFPIVALLCLCIYISAYRSTRSSDKPCLGRSAAVVVLGDIGRSPRMCFHVQSLANEGYKVAIVGYPGSALPTALRRSSVKSHHLRSPPAFIARLPRKAFIIAAPFKLLLQAISLFLELTINVHPPPEVVLVQTPPALPTLLVVKMAAALVKARVIIDWHNLAYTILALRLGAKSKLVKLAEWLERWSGRGAYAHLFVTEAMKSHLSASWKLKGEKKALHDRPPAHFRRATLGETHKLMTKLIPMLQPPIEDEFLPKAEGAESTPFTKVLRPEASAHKEGGDREESGLQSRQDRPALVVSSTSWTADEDFGLLLRAARLYEYRARTLAEACHSVSNSPSVSPVHSRSSTADDSTYHTLLSPISPSSAASTASHFSYTSGCASPIRTSKQRRRASHSFPHTTPATPTLPHYPASLLPRMLIIVTGKGELKSRYLAEIRHLEFTEEWRYVRIRTAWLETEDYPVLLGSADIGVSLHTSSSGLDLPMKVVDMLGCGLPVCALDFDCLDELVKDGMNGVVFKDAETLARQWESLFARHPEKNWLVSGDGMRRPFELEGMLELEGANDFAEGLTASTARNLLSSARVEQGVPMSPNPSMTLLPSPGLAPKMYGRDRGPVQGQVEGGGKGRSGTSTWGGNWKAVMRPLLSPPNVDASVDERDRASVDPNLSRTSALKLDTALGRGILFSRRSKKGCVPASQIDVDEPSQTSMTQHGNEQGQEDMLAGTADSSKIFSKNGFNFVSQTAKPIGSERHIGLRQRKSLSKPPNSHSSLPPQQDPIPVIQVSKPPTPP